jgi:acetyl esterase/lipase
VGVAGDSAGGTLAAAVCLRARDADGPSIAHQTLICPMLEYGSRHPSIDAFGTGHLLDREAIAWCWDNYLPSAADGANPLASPAAATDLSALPPTLVITAEYDPLRDEGEAYAMRLRAAGVPVTLRRYDGLIHGFFVMTGAIERSAEALDEIGADIAAALRSTVAAD